MSAGNKSTYRKTFVDSVVLYALHFANYLPSLVLFPYLARRLGPFHLGLVASSQAVALIVTTIIEYGFSLTAARDVAHHRNEPMELTRICSGVLGARLILSVIAVGTVLVMALLVPAFRQYPVYLIGGLFFGLVQGFRFDWFFLGMDQMSRIGIPELVTKPLSLVVIMFVVTRPSRAPWVLIIQALGAASAALWNATWVVNQVHIVAPRLKESVASLRSSWSFFLSKSSIALYTSANTVILGIFASQGIVSFYAGADKLTKALIAGLQPFGQILYPKVNRALVTSPQHAMRLLRLGLIAFASVSIALAIASSLVSPFLVRLLLGPQYEASIPIVRILSGLIVIASLNSFFSYQWVLPFGLDRLLARSTFIAGGLDLVLSLVLSKLYQGKGCAVAVVIAEAVATTYLYFSLRNEGLDPLAPSSIVRRSRSSNAEEIAEEEQLREQISVNEAVL